MSNTNCTCKQEIEKALIKHFEKSCGLFEYLPAILKTEEICKISVQKLGYLLKHVPKEYITEELCMIACKQDGYAIQFVPNQFKTEAVIQTALRSVAFSREQGFLELYLPKK